MLRWPPDCRAQIRRTQHRYANGQPVWEVRARYTAQNLDELRHVQAVIAERPTWAQALHAAKLAAGWRW